MCDLKEAAEALEASGMLPDSMKDYFRLNPKRAEDFLAAEADYLARLREIRPEATA
jgi:hypothetical protein